MHKAAHVDRRVVLIGVASTIIIAASKEDTDGAFALLDYELAPGFSSLPPHRHHREHEAVYVLEGQLLAQVGEVERLLSPGGFVWLPRGIVHVLRNPGPEPAHFLLLALPAGSEQCWRDLEAMLQDGSPWDAASLAPVLLRYAVQLVTEPGAD